MRLKAVSRLVGIVVLISGVSTIGYLVWLGDHREKEYKLVSKGDSEARIKEMLGSPFRVSNSPRWICWDSQDSSRANDGECVQEYWYSRPLSITDEMWTIGFDRDGKVVSKFYYPSGE
jgi:hypothetical protein